jgi:hypothetical protein
VPLLSLQDLAIDCVIDTVFPEEKYDEIIPNPNVVMDKYFNVLPLPPIVLELVEDRLKKIVRIKLMKRMKLLDNWVIRICVVMKEFAKKHGFHYFRGGDELTEEQKARYDVRKLSDEALEREIKNVSFLKIEFLYKLVKSHVIYSLYFKENRFTLPRYMERYMCHVLAICKYFTPFRMKESLKYDNVKNSINSIIEFFKYIQLIFEDMKYLMRMFESNIRVFTLTSLEETHVVVGRLTMM